MTINWIVFVATPVYMCQLNTLKLSCNQFNLKILTNLQGDVESEMKVLRLKLKQTMEMYNSACKEAISAQNKVIMLSL